MLSIFPDFSLIKQRWFLLFLSALLSFLVLPAVAQTSKPSVIFSIKTSDTFQRDSKIEAMLDSAHKRKVFEQALRALDKKQYKRFNQKLKKLSDYPLVTYLHYLKLKKNLYRATNQEVSAFLKHHQNSPYADKIRSQWLDRLAQKESWHSYLKFYQPQQSTRRQCYYVTALIKIKGVETTRSFIDSLWLSDRSQPDSCDPVFEAWQNAGYITAEIRWQRIIKVMAKGRLRLATYLARELSKKDRQFLKLWQKNYRKVQQLAGSRLLHSRHRYRNEALVQLLGRLAGSSPEKAERAYLKISQRLRFSPAEKQRLYRSIGLSYARKRQNGGWKWLKKIHPAEDDPYMQKWRVRAAILEKNYRAIVKAIEWMPMELQRKQTWRFWKAWANDKLGNHKIAREIYRKLARERGYYAFLAADILQLEYNFVDKPLPADEQALERLRRHKGVQSAYEFLMLGKMTEAKREWFYLTSHLSDDKEKLLAAKLAEQWGWTDRAILTIAGTSFVDDVSMRFPLKFEQIVKKYSRKHGLDPAYTYAIIRRESAFSVDARSAVGAMGLMQIMPQTAKYIAKKLKLAYRNKKQLHSGYLNVKMGTFYLRDMLEKFSNQPVLASAAYNAGQHRVKRWLPESGSVSAIEWVETIPFTETRRYVKAVLAYTAIYEYRMGLEVTRLSQRMPDITAKKDKAG